MFECENLCFGTALKERASFESFIYWRYLLAGPGRKIVKQKLAEIKNSENIDFTIANGENASGGVGLSKSSKDEIFAAGVDVITGGNHSFRNREIFNYIDNEPRVIRPANYPPEANVPGLGYYTFTLPSGHLFTVINLMGTVMMSELENPFHFVDRLLEKLASKTPNILVDFHAEATSEKVAMGWHLDGKVTAMVGTHTHIPTADERILHHGTAYQTDVGMTGPFDSCIGVQKEIILKGFLTKLPVRHEIATGEVKLCATKIEFNEETGQALSIKRLCIEG